MWSFVDEANFDEWDESSALPSIMDEFAEYMFAKMGKAWPANTKVGSLITNLQLTIAALSPRFILRRTARIQRKKWTS